jgi:hypothetical protein
VVGGVVGVGKGDRVIGDVVFAILKPRITALVSEKPWPLPVPVIDTLGVRAISSLKSAAALALSMKSRLIAACGWVVVSEAVSGAASAVCDPVTMMSEVVSDWRSLA